MFKAITLCVMLFSLTACQTAYYSAMEKVGYHKRDILVDRVKDAQTSQTEAQVQFQSALEQFQSVVSFDGGELEDAYNSLNDQYVASLDSAENVSNRIDKVESVADDLFDEWEDELDQYTSAKLKARSQKQLRATQTQYGKLIKSMRKAESKMQPFLSALNDNVLYLKHNLNAKAVGALKGELGSIQKDVKSLIAEINSSIEQSNKFIKSLE
ncbi:DUF2959 domain-containing protein [Algibacillus agarilyticus]|uniref:DUF2959 domain-containing protein n=1 Tax=Algibacillus agarilyticus TaxID=2234133 RepID=UPI000DCFA2B2|nr:DUF2959 domain-containing protein [Algibacillus agarilyticus]